MFGTAYAALLGKLPSGALQSRPPIVPNGDGGTGELKTEPERIRDIYQVKSQRIEPVGLVYLWPVTG